jgi:hypothetical protein
VSYLRNIHDFVCRSYFGNPSSLHFREYLNRERITSCQRDNRGESSINDSVLSDFPAIGRVQIPPGAEPTLSANHKVRCHRALWSTALQGSVYLCLTLLWPWYILSQRLIHLDRAFYFPQGTQKSLKSS